MGEHRALGTLQSGLSGAGCTVTLAVDCGSYQGAQPYYTVTRRGAGHRQRQRHTPDEARAQAYYLAFLRDVTDPQALAEAVAGLVTEPSTGRRS